MAYAIAEDESLWDAFVWTIDTVATTGSIRPPSDTAGEIVKVLLTFLGVGTLFYALVAMTELVVTGELGTILSERRVRRMTERLETTTSCAASAAWAARWRATCAPRARCTS